MPWCPKCKNEYREGYVACADCGEDLVGQEPVAASTVETPRRPLSGLVSVALAFVVFVPLFLVCLIPGFFVYDWLELQGYVLGRGADFSLESGLLAAAAAGFLTGAFLSRLVRPLHVYVAGTIAGAALFALAAWPTGGFWPSASELLPILGAFLVLPQMAATLASSWGIALVKEGRARYLLCAIGFLLVLLAASLLMYPLYKAVSR